MTTIRLTKSKSALTWFFFSELIEHPDGGEGVDLTKAIFYHPNLPWDVCQHTTPYRYDELGGLIPANGSDIKALRRVHDDAVILRMLRIHFAAPVHRYMNGDSAPSILVVAQRGH